MQQRITLIGHVKNPLTGGPTIVKVELANITEMFADGSGFGDPEARRNAEIRLEVALSQQQGKTAARLNFLTGLLVIVGLLQLVILAFQVWGK